jgi:hypothetical protein
MKDYTIVGWVDDAIPFVVTRSPFLEWRCCISILPEGGGEDRPLLERTAKCQHRTPFLVGAAPTCECHIIYAAKLGKLDLRNLPPFSRCGSGVAA